MKRFSVCKLGELKEGDRFYYLGNRSKTIWQVNDVRVDNTTRTVMVERVEHGHSVNADPRKGNSDKKVVYLRNVNEI